MIVRDKTLTAAQVKTKYEFNANTNVFSDAEKTKLANLALPSKHLHLGGLQIKNNVANPSHQMDIFLGNCRDIDDTENITLPVTQTIDITTIGANGLDVGAEAIDTYYFIFAIKNPVTGTVAGLFSTSPTTPTLPVGFTKKRLIGSIKNNNSGHFERISTIGNGNFRGFNYRDNRTIIAFGSAPVWTEVDVSAYVPIVARYIFLSITAWSTGVPANCSVQIREKNSTASARIALGYNQGDMAVDLVLDNQKFDYLVGANSSSFISLFSYWIEL